MDYSAEQINSAFSNLSIEVSQALFDIDIDSKIDIISKKYNLGPESADTLKFNTSITIAGLSNHDDFTKNVSGELGLSMEISKNVIYDVNQMIFQPIEARVQKIKENKEFLSQNNTTNVDSVVPVVKVTTGEEIPLPKYIETNPNSEDIPLPPYKPIEDIIPMPVPPPVTTSVFKKPENPIISNIETNLYNVVKDPAIESKKDSNIFAQKLNTATVTNKVVSDQTVPPTPTENKTITPNSTPSSAKDPYREVLE